MEEGGEVGEAQGPGELEGAGEGGGGVADVEGYEAEGGG